MVTGSIADRHCVETILRNQGVAGLGTAQRDTADLPWSRCPVQRVVGVDRLVRPMEGAKADVDDAGPQVRPIIMRPADLPRQRRQCPAVQALRHGRWPAAVVMEPMISSLGIRCIAGALLIFW